jgi:hypothetical protein
MRYTACQSDLLDDICWSYHPMSQWPSPTGTLVRAYRHQPGSRFVAASLLFAVLAFGAYLFPADLPPEWWSKR